MSISYQITFKVGGTSGNKVKEVTGNIHTLEIPPCKTEVFTEPSDTTNNTQYVTTSNN